MTTREIRKFQLVPHNLNSLFSQPNTTQTELKLIYSPHSNYLYNFICTTINTAIAHHVVPHFLLSKNKALLSEYLQNLWLVNPKFARKQIQYTAMLNVVQNVVSNVVPFVVTICCTHLLCAPICCTHLLCAPVCLFSTILTSDYLPKNKHPDPLISPEGF